MTEAANEAERLLEDLGLTDMPVKLDVVCKAMSSSNFSITLNEEPMSSDKFHGISIGNENGAEILINANISNPHRRRFTAAHEIGHVHLHIQTGKRSKFECTAEDISAGKDSNNIYEKEANAFASSLLMPAATVSPLIRRNDLTWPLIQRVASMCDVSLEAATRRTITLSKDACCLIVHKKGQMWTPIKSRAFTAYVPNQPYPPHLLRQPDGGQALSLVDNFEECDFSDWTFPENAIGKLFYSSIHNEEFNRTMTLLLHEEEIDDDEEVFSDPKF